MAEANGSRSERFGRRLRGDHVPSFAELADPPRWIICGDEEQGQIACVLALLVARPDIDGELNGQRLSELATAVGEDRFDLVCEADVAALHLADRPQSLPAARDLDRRGRALLAAAPGKAALSQLATLAHEICSTTKETVA